MKKCLKWFAWIFASLVVLVLVLAVATPLWLGPVAKMVANCAVPKITGTEFSVARIEINPYAGHLQIENLQLANPAGYAAKDAVRVGKLSVDVALGELLDDLLHVKDIQIRSPYASYISKDSVNNFDAILANVKKALKLDEKKEEKKEKSTMRVLIDHLEISDVSYRVGPLPFDLPLGFPIVLNDLGKQENANGVTFEEMGAVLVSACSQAATKGGAALKNVSGAMGDAAKKAGEATTGAVNAAGDAAGDAAKAAGDAAKAAGDAAGDAAKAAGDAAKAAGDAAKAAGDAAKAVGDTAKGLFKDAGKLFKK